MKPALAGLALGAMLSLAPIVQAATTLAFPAFTITYIDGPAPENWNIGVAAQTPLTTSISLDTLNQDVQYFPADDLTGVGATNGGGHQSVLQVDVNAGYRVTGVSVHALAYGELGIGQVPDAEPGSADNFASLGFLLSAPGTVLPFPGSRRISMACNRSPWTAVRCPWEARSGSISVPRCLRKPGVP